MNPQWSVMALRTITPNHRDLRQISLTTPYTLIGSNYDHDDPTKFRDRVGETVCGEWSELDHLLARLWESHSIRPKVRYSLPAWIDEEGARGCMESLLPEVSRRGVVDLIEDDRF
jgi:hypothetical protein